MVWNQRSETLNRLSDAFCQSIVYRKAIILPIGLLRGVDNHTVGQPNPTVGANMRSIIGALQTSAKTVHRLNGRYQLGSAPADIIRILSYYWNAIERVCNGNHT
jgi:hypothetical protein